MAETHYQLGVAQGFNAQYDEAVESLRNAINLIQSRIGNLEKVEGEEAKKEVTDLKALIPEIEEKIKDTEASIGLCSSLHDAKYFRLRTSRKNLRRSLLRENLPGLVPPRPPR